MQFSWKNQGAKGLTRRLVRSTMAIAILVAAAACSPKGSEAAAATDAGSGSAKESRSYAPVPSVAVFVPGVTAGSPVYEMLVSGVKKAVEEVPGATVKVLEGGYNQADWQKRLAELVAEGRYGLIVTSNPSMPTICDELSKSFPNQHFLILDGYLAGNQRIHTLRYNQREEGYLAGYIAGLVSAEAGKQPRKVGLVAGQEYPAMNGTILPSYLEGAKAASGVSDLVADFRVVGNWYDADKGRELASSMIRDGAKVILAISGGANAGVLQAAAEAGASVVWFDVSGYDAKPGTVIGSAIIMQERAAYERTKAYLEGSLPFGEAETVGVADGFVDFDQESALYKQTVSEEVRAKMASQIDAIRAGTVVLPLGE